MSIRHLNSICALAAFAMLLLSAGGASAKSAVQKECSDKYQAAKTAKELNGQSYNQFYKQCAAEAKTEKGATPASPAPPATPTIAAAPEPAPVAPNPNAGPIPTLAPVAPTTTAAPAPQPATPAAPTTTVGAAVFPKAIGASFVSQKPGKARMNTCLAQYHANQPTNGNGGMKWIEKGGGYYSECTKRLKGDFKSGAAATF